MDTRACLPQDVFAGTFIGRVWVPDHMTGTVAGPSPALIDEKGVFDLSVIAPTCSELLNGGFGGSAVSFHRVKYLGSYNDIMANTMQSPRNEALPYFLSPVDLQCVKACGVTFMVSMLERIIEERAGGVERSLAG